MADAQVMVIQLRRMENSQPWGFRMRGGSQQGMPLFVEQVSPNGRSAKAGLVAGDLILLICGASMQTASHDEAKREILRAGNDLDLTIQRTGGPAAAPAPQQQQQQQQPQQRAQVVEEPTMKMGGPTYKNVQPKTYQILKDELPASEKGAGPTGGGGPGPASIFSRKREERSGYLKAKGPTIQKAYGQKQ